MSWGSLSEKQEQAILPYIIGREVYDLGAGICTLSKRLLELGAAKVIAVDKEFPPSRARHRKISCKQAYFHELVKDKTFRPEVLFISWPANNSASDVLAEIIERAKVTIYLGTNFNGTMCGSSLFFTTLSSRKLLSYVPDRHNNLIIVSSDEIVDRDLTPEERAILEDEGCITGWDEAHDTIGTLT